MASWVCTNVGWFGRDGGGGGRRVESTVQWALGMSIKTPHFLLIPTQPPGWVCLYECMHNIK